VIRGLVAAVFAGLAILLAVLTVLRARLPYDEAGRYFDPADAVTYDRQAVLVYGLLALLAAVVAVVAVVWRRRARL
jgi:cell division protein FtsX